MREVIKVKDLSEDRRVEKKSGASWIKVKRKVLMFSAGDTMQVGFELI